MPDYRRVIIPGGTFFFTLVTFDRKPILTTEFSRHILRQAWKQVQRSYPFIVEAICLLPEHLHCIWTLPENDGDYSLRWRAIKALFSKEYLRLGGNDRERNVSRKKRGEAAIWQRRFWEHTIRDADDFVRHFDYIHYSPVKHGLVQQVKDWPWSSYHKYLARGYYDLDWGNIGPESLANIDETGE